MTARRSWFGWGHVIICGCLWGLLASIAVGLTQAVGDLRLAAWLSFTGRIFPAYVIAGLIWAAGAKLAQESRRRYAVLAFTTLFAWAANLGATVLVSAPIAPGNFGQMWTVPLGDLAIYVLWTSAVYGGLYVLGFFSTQRAIGLRRRLDLYRLARDEAEARLREARLRAVREQVQPAVILTSLSALADSLEGGLEDRSRLFDAIIAFLRAVTPDLRGDGNTLSREIAALERYAELRRILKTGPPEWRISATPLPDGIQAPPLRLLTAVDQVSRMASAAATLDICGQSQEDAFILSIRAHAEPPLPMSLIAQLQDASRNVLGATAVYDAPGPIIVEIRIPRSPWRSPATVFEPVSS